MAFSMIIWNIRHWIWSNWLTLRHTLNRPQRIGAPPKKKGNIKIVTLRQKHKDLIPLDIPVYDHLPPEENKITVRFVRATTLSINRVFPARQDNLPEIDEDISLALDKVLTPNYRRAFRSPRFPQSLSSGDVPDIEQLAVESPYYLCMQRNDKGEICWDFEVFDKFEHHKDVLSIALTAVFQESEDGSALHATEIRSKELGVIRPGDQLWNSAKRLAVCAATTYITLTRHFNYVHLVSAAMWAVGTRNELPIDHPIFRLMWPTNLNALYTNYGITEVQLYPDGDFVNMFSFTHKGLMQCYEEMTPRYRASLMDPRADRAARGLKDTKFNSPTQRNLEDLFDIMHNHAKRYIYAYYSSDDELRVDKDVQNWITTMESLIPNGLGEFLGSGLSRDNVARMLGAVIYEGCTTHDLIGTTLWDYQLWVDRNPVRVNRDGSRISLSVLHRVIINNFALQLARSPLLDDYSAVALDEKGRQLFTQWFEECKKLQSYYDQHPADIWRMEPKNLEVSMNA